MYSNPARAKASKLKLDFSPIRNSVSLRRLISGCVWFSVATIFLLELWLRFHPLNWLPSLVFLCCLMLVFAISAVAYFVLEYIYHQSDDSDTVSWHKDAPAIGASCASVGVVCLGTMIFWQHQDCPVLSATPEDGYVQFLWFVISSVIAIRQFDI